jgi:Kdo2-lipid IVA lauroyltransferase/acyltransferase
MRRRSALRNGFEFGLALAALKSLEWSPSGVALRLARRYIRLLDLAIPRLRRVARHNLLLTMRRLDDTAREEIVHGVFLSIARILAAFAHFPAIRRENLDAWIRCEGMEHVDAARKRGKGILFATAHLGNWELSAFAYAMLVEPMDVVVRPLDNPLIDRLVERRRGLSGNRLILKTDSARTILKALAGNRAVGILIDQNASPESGTFVDFFGVPACAGTGFAKLAARSGAAVIPGFALWSAGERKYVLRFLPPVEISGDPVRDTQAIQAVLEQVIREHPDQWLWVHRRWKTRPAGAPPLYEKVPDVKGAL